MSDEQQDQDQRGGLQLEEAKPELKQPKMFQVIILNDDFTPMEFVVHVLEHFFALDHEKATRIMLNVHHNGKGVCGTYTRDIAETKMVSVNEYSRTNEHPLLCTIEEAWISMLSKELEQTLNDAFRQARERRHEFMTVEHLLFALLGNPTAVHMLNACGADLSSLSLELQQFIEQNTPLLETQDERETQTTLGFQRVLQRAVFHVQASGKKEVTGANVLVAIFG